MLPKACCLNQIETNFFRKLWFFKKKFLVHWLCVTILNHIESRVTRTFRTHVPRLAARRLLCLWRHVFFFNFHKARHKLRFLGLTRLKCCRALLRLVLLAWKVCSLSTVLLLSASQSTLLVSVTRWNEQKKRQKKTVNTEQRQDKQTRAFQRYNSA